MIALRVGEDGFAIGNVVEAIYDATTSVNQGGFGCHLLNYSGGGYTIYNSVRKAISYAAHNGVIFVAAKGNDDTTNKHYPSDYADNLVISVGASNGLDERASFSNYGNNVDFVAPGTTDLLFTTKRVEQDTYGTFSGTSGAAPVVTGIAALLKSANINLHRDDIENILQISADKVGSIPYTNGYNEQMGNGRVNAGRALEFLQAPYILQQHTTTGGTSQNLSGDGEGLTFLNDAGNSGLAEGWYYGQMYQVTKTVNIPVSICNENYVWTRTVGATSGWSAANPNNNLGYSFVVSQTSSTVTLRTFVYYIKTNSLGQTINTWYPTSPQNAVMAYTTLTHSPITISGPTTVCTSNSTFNINNIQPGTSITWNVSSNLQIVSGQGTTSVIVKQSSYYNYGAGWVTATINACGTMVTLPNYQVWVGIPNSPGSVIGSTSPNIGSTQYYYATSAASGASSHTWTLPYENGSCTYCWSIYSQGTPTAIYANVGEASGYVQIAGNNVCGTGGASILYVTPNWKWRL
ncbi:MAG: hypothetical protein KatS3mg032_0778 [Cyclobacteriaceae bacterium]|nr:MAG: hypothetical protein KatS3mg032_0778 [Cyclobacteriaceae bacterium]